MKRQFRKVPQYVRANTNANNTISTEEEMTNFIHEYNIIDRVICRVNDRDFRWEYDTPELFASACFNDLYDNLEYLANDYGFQIVGNPIDLVSNEIWDELKDQASSGDFDP